MPAPATKVALVGSGFIADVHLQVLRSVPGTQVVAVCDPVRERAERLARRHGVPAVCQSVAELLGLGGIDAVHVLVPPEVHREVAAQCLAAGLHVLCEKPLALEEAHLDELAAAALKSGRTLGVNHNLTFVPAVARLRQHLAAGRLGRLEHIAIVHNVPLRQLQTGDVGHFMFRSEANILFEQGVHMFSLVFDLLGRCEQATAAVAEPRLLPHGVRFFDDWNVTLRCERGTATVRMAFGRSMPESTLHAVGSDGAAFLDLQRSSCLLRQKSRWLEFLDHGLDQARAGLHLAWRGAVSVAGYGLALFKLRFPEDPFLRGMRGSLRAFHDAVRGGRPAPVGIESARAVLAMCRMTAAAAGASFTPPSRPQLPAPGAARAGEVVVLGGAGFLGRRCVQRLRALGRPVSLVVRRPHLLPADLRSADIRLFHGDAADPAVLAAAFAGADAVLHLATVAGDDPARIEATMASGVRAAAAACQQAGVRRFVYTSSTAALYLGGREPMSGAAPTDPQPAARGAYARGKIAAERELQQARTGGLDVVIVRPAIVVGQDGLREHSGVGLWVRDNHCVGWGLGNNPLPFVLADDCADGLVAAVAAQAARNQSYNLAGPVRLTAREYVHALRVRTGRAYQYHPTPLLWMWLQEVGKHFVKFLARRPRELPSQRDFRSRAFTAPLDCRDAERDLAFRPEADRERFLQRLFGPRPDAP